jgi:hypothetical protein
VWEVTPGCTTPNWSPRGTMQSRTEYLGHLHGLCGQTDGGHTSPGAPFRGDQIPRQLPWSPCLPFWSLVIPEVWQKQLRVSPRLGRPRGVCCVVLVQVFSDCVFTGTRLHSDPESRVFDVVPRWTLVALSCYCLWPFCL